MKILIFFLFILLTGCAPIPPLSNTTQNTTCEIHNTTNVTCPTYYDWWTMNGKIGDPETTSIGFNNVKIKSFTTEIYCVNLTIHDDGNDWWAQCDTVSKGVIND